MMVGFDPDALARLLRQWKARSTGESVVVAAQWRQAVHELSLVIAVSPQASKLPQAVAAVDPSGGEREIPPAREKSSTLNFGAGDEDDAA